MENQNYGFIKTNEKDATSEITSSLKFFGEDVLQTKFPSYVDGLKDITRRIIWFSRNYKEAKGLNKVIGDIGDYHEGGDSSIYGAMIRLAQPFMVGHSLITIEGKSGEYYDPGAAAAPRYLKAYLSEFSKDIFINGVNLRTLPMVPTKEFSDMEPRYLIPRIPTALILGNLTVGFGFKSHIPMIDFEDVCNLVMIFSEYYQQGRVGIPENKVLAKYLIPSFPIKNLIRNRQELLKAYSSGDYSRGVDIEGWMEVAGNTLVLRTVPYGVDFGTVTRIVREQMKDKKHWLWGLLNTVNQYSSDAAELSFELKKGMNPFNVLNSLRSILKFNVNWHPIHSYMKNGRALTLSPATLTYLWYNERAISIAGGLKYRQTDLVFEKMKLEAMLIVSNNTDDVIDIVKKSEDENDAIRKLHHKFTELTHKQAKIIANLKISTLSRSNRKQILSDLEQVEVDLKNITNSFTKVNEQIYNDAQYLKKKYRSTKETRFSDDFIGYVQFGNLGVSHFFNKNEMYDLLNTKGWGNVSRSIHFYDNKLPKRFFISNNKLLPLERVSKDIACEGIVCQPTRINPAESNIIFINKETNNTCVVDSYAEYSNDFTICAVGDKFYAIHRNGKITLDDINTYSRRKTVSKGSKTDLLYVLSMSAKDIVVFHMNDKNPNVLRIDRILSSDTLGCLRTIPTGTEYILDTVPMNKSEVYLNIPTECTKSNVIEFILVKQVKNLFKDQNNILVQLNKNSKLKRNNNVRSFYILDC